MYNSQKNAPFSPGQSTRYQQILGILFTALLLLFSVHLSATPQALSPPASADTTDIRQAQLQPITIVAVRGNAFTNQRMSPGTRDRLTHDAATMLRELPEINGIRKSGGYGLDPVLRGFKYDQLNILVDGVLTASAACPNRMDPPTSQISLNMIDQVDIIKGPYALRYGNAVGGTINFRSAEAAYGQQPSLGGRFSAGMEFNGSVYRSELMLTHHTPISRTELFGSWSKGGNYNDGNGTSVTSGYERASAGLRLSLRPAPQHEVRMSLARNLARDTRFASLPMDLIHDRTWSSQATHQWKPDFGSLREVSTSVYGSFVDHYMSNELRDLNPRMSDSSTDARTTNMGGRTETLLQWGLRRMYLGADLRAERAEGVRERVILMGPMAGRIFFDNAWQDSQILRGGLFSEYHVTTPQLQATFAARLEWNQATVFDEDPGFAALNQGSAEASWNPALSAGLGWNWSPSLRSSLWVGRVSRSASITERFINLFPVGVDPYEMLGNPALKPEINNQIDLITRWSGRTTQAEITVFSAYLQQYITGVVDRAVSPRMAASPGVRRFTNIDNARIFGAEASFTQNGLWFHQQVKLAWQHGQNRTNNEPLPEIAPIDLRYQLGASLWAARLEPELSVRHVWTQDRIATSFGEQATSGFTLVDLRARIRLPRQLMVLAGIDNLTNVRYHEHLSRNVSGTTGIPIFAPGRNLHVTVTMQF